MPDPVPHDIRRLADERARARRARDWATADRLKAELQAAGWRPVDAGTLYSLERLPPAVVEGDGGPRYGASAAVPSRLGEAASTGVSIVLVAADRAGLLPRAVAALQAGSPGAQLVVVGDDPAPPVAAELASLPRDVEVVGLASRLGAAAAANAGIRRATGAVIVMLDLGAEPQGDLGGALASALEDPGVGVAGIAGLATDDLVHFRPAAPDGSDAVAVDRLAMAFRREDYAERGPLDERFTLPDYLDAWWSLVLRDVPDDADVDARPRRAVVVATPFERLAVEESAPDERRVRRQRYRFLKTFATRRDLLAGTARSRTRARSGASRGSTTPAHNESPSGSFSG
jgi:hypothetical protein